MTFPYAHVNVAKMMPRRGKPMTAQTLVIDDESRWIDSTTEKSRQIQAIYARIVADRELSLWKMYEICSKNLSRLEEQRSLGQDDVRIHNQIETTKLEIAEIEAEMKGEGGLLFQVRELFWKNLRKSDNLPLRELD
jgi:hypothetical protein